MCVSTCGKMILCKRFSWLSIRIYKMKREIRLLRMLKSMPKGMAKSWRNSSTPTSNNLKLPSTVPNNSEPPNSHSPSPASTSPKPSTSSHNSSRPPFPSHNANSPKST